MSKRAWGIFLLVLAFVIVGFVAYKNAPERQVPIVFSPRGELEALWEEYKKNYIEPDTFRVVDHQNEGVTTSEGQSYAMLRAVWLNDKDTFDKTWKWTEDNLKREDGLYSWLFGRQPDGTYGVLTERNGHNTATDADVDIAVALIFASGRWNEAEYLDRAKELMNSIWQNEVVMVRGKPYLVSNNVEKDAPELMVLNPSYYAPYAYRIFAKLDPKHPWSKVADTSYEVLNESMELPLDKSSSAFIPPDWVLINKRTGALTAPNRSGLSTRTSFDALRVPWRIYLDWAWYGDDKAKSTLEKMNFFSSEWREKRLLYTSYEHDGTPAVQNQTAAFYGGTLGHFMVTDKETARSVYESKLQVLFNPDSNTWRVKLGYYDENWAWFGIALYNNLLPNLSEN